MVFPRVTLIALAASIGFVVVAAKPIGLDERGLASDIVDDLQDAASELVGDVETSLSPDSTNGTVDPSLLPDFKYYAEYSSAAYCPTHLDGGQLVCPGGYCPTVEANNVTVDIEFANSALTDTTGFVARDDTTSTIVVAFRGSQSLRNWITNSIFVPKSIDDWCTGCEVHTGFYDAFEEEFSTVKAAVDALKAANPGYGLAFTGHSLGGALATIAATEFRRLGYTVTLYTFGAPRIGNDALSTFITAAGTNYRVTHLDDPVPRLPPLATGYRHISPEYHIFRGDTGIRPIDVNVVEGIVNFGGNTGAVEQVGLNVTAHGHYLLSTGMSACNTETGFEFKARA
ncbi:hypothetical protein RUND412_002596 [Rhizina undulata]